MSAPKIGPSDIKSHANDENIFIYRTVKPSVLQFVLEPCLKVPIGGYILDNIANSCYIDNNIARGGDATVTLYIRDFPDELSKALKIRAVKEGKSLRELCIELLESAVEGKEG